MMMMMMMMMKLKDVNLDYRFFFFFFFFFLPPELTPTRTLKQDWNSMSIKYDTTQTEQSFEMATVASPSNTPHCNFCEKKQV